MVRNRLTKCRSKFDRVIQVMKGKDDLLDLLDEQKCPLFYTGDGATMYQLDNTNIRFSQTEISFQCLLFGVQSAYLLFPLIIYGNRDDAKYLKLAQEGLPMMLFDNRWSTSPLAKVHGAVGDTKWIWQFLQRVNDKCWSLPLGGSLCTRKELCITDSETHMTQFYPSIYLTNEFL